MMAITLGNQQILRVSNTKFLDIYIDDGLQWGDHFCNDRHLYMFVLMGCNVAGW